MKKTIIKLMMPLAAAITGGTRSVASAEFHRRSLTENEKKCKIVAA